jgi:hypothetical protein
MSEPRTFRSYEEFFSFYLEQHSEAGNRWMHSLGTILGLLNRCSTLISRS